MARLRISIVGAGRLGTALAALLAGQDEFTVDVIDPSEDALDRFDQRQLPIRAHLLRHREDLPAMLAKADVTVAAVPEAALDQVAAAAGAAGTHFLDFSPAKAHAQSRLRELSRERAVFSGCGVSPGIIDNVACGLVHEFSPITDLTIRVGSIPRFPTNRLGYGQIWNVDGLIDEYTRPCAAIRDGRQVMIEPLEAYERIVMDGVGYECFTTAGGLEDLEALTAAAPRNVVFKTLRYPGHLEYMRFLLDDLGLRGRRDMLRSLLLNGLPVIQDDLLLLVVTARGERNSQMAERTISHRFVPNPKIAPFNALTTVAAGYAATLLLLFARGEIADAGLVPHQRIETNRLFSERFLCSLKCD